MYTRGNGKCPVLNDCAPVNGETLRGGLQARKHLSVLFVDLATDLTELVIGRVLGRSSTHHFRLHMEQHL